MTLSLTLILLCTLAFIWWVKLSNLFKKAEKADLKKGKKNGF